MSPQINAFNIHLSCNVRYLNKAGLTFIKKLKVIEQGDKHSFTGQSQAQVIITIQPMSNNNQLSVTVQNASRDRLLHMQLDLYGQTFKTFGLAPQTKKHLSAQEGPVKKLIFLAAVMAKAVSSQ